MENTRSIIYLHNLRHNLRLIRSLIPETTKICVAVKADGYGHGAVSIAQTAESEGVEWFGVANTREGIELRDNGIQGRILLFGMISMDNVKEIIAYNITPIAADPAFIALLEKNIPGQKEKVPVHIIIDTGMGRLGCAPGETITIAKKINTSEKLRLEGVCTHFSNADTRDQAFSRKQLELFKGEIEAIQNEGIDPGILHAANSGAIIGLPESHMNMVRPGIMTYGYYPSKDQERTIPLKPVMEFVTKVVFIKRVPPDTPISYGSTYRTKGETNIATLAAGYADGYFRLLSNTSKVLIRGKLYPIVGRVTMDMIMADLGPDSDVQCRDEAVLFGPDPRSLSAEDLADRCGTIPYEITCAVSKRVIREYIDL